MRGLELDVWTPKQAGGGRWAKALLGVLLCAGWISLPGAASAAAPQEEPAEETAAEEGEAESESLFDKLSIHGHLSQAYAFSDGNQTVGITEDGTADYRTAALQIRSDMTENDVFVVQFSHERLGASPSQAKREDVELDWIFYQRRFGETSIKVGRIPIPFGLYNEVRDVGTVLPFYRPSLPLYEETSFTTETVDGALVAHGFDFGGWHLNGDIHYGNWEFFDARLNPVKCENSMGIELWLDTPVNGLKVGIGGLRYDTSGPSTPKSHRQLSHLSLAGHFSRVEAEVELKRDTAQLAAGGRAVSVDGGYGRLGFNLTEKVVLQAEYAFLDIQFPRTDKAEQRDKALGLSYRFRPDLVLKGEYHWDDGFRVENRPGLIPGRPIPNYKTQYGILSLATSF